MLTPEMAYARIRAGEAVAKVQSALRSDYVLNDEKDVFALMNKMFVASEALYSLYEMLRSAREPRPDLAADLPAVADSLRRTPLTND